MEPTRHGILDMAAPGAARRVLASRIKQARQVQRFRWRAMAPSGGCLSWRLDPARPCCDGRAIRSVYRARILSGCAARRLDRRWFVSISPQALDRTPAWRRPRCMPDLRAIEPRHRTSERSVSRQLRRARRPSTARPRARAGDT
jgi:hypothetical protein